MSSAATANTGNEMRNWTLDEMSVGSMSLPELLQELLILATKIRPAHVLGALLLF